MAELTPKVRSGMELGMSLSGFPVIKKHVLPARNDQQAAMKTNAFKLRELRLERVQKLGSLQIPNVNETAEGNGRSVPAIG